MNDPIFNIAVFSHFFKVSNPNPRALAVVFNFCSKYVVESFKPVNKFAKFNKFSKFKEVKQVIFAGRTHNNREFRFHIGQLNEFIGHLTKNHITSDMYSVRRIALYQPQHIDVSLRSQWTLRDYQKPICDFLQGEYIEANNHSKMIALQTGGGKSQPLDAAIMTPSGWSTIGEMQVGSMVCTPCGEVVKINGIYPQGVTDVYKISFSDGRSTECTLDHLWKVYSSSFPVRWKTLPTHELLSILEAGLTDIYIPLIHVYGLDGVSLPLDPYMLGMYLGTGRTRDGRLTFSTADADLIKSIEDKLPSTLTTEQDIESGYKIVINTRNPQESNIYIEILDELILTNVKTHLKFIPEIYFNGSVSQRLDLVQGMMDTNGYVSSNNTCHYKAHSKKLAKDFQRLIWSLGGVASITYRKYVAGNTSNNRVYQVNVWYKSPHMLFKLERKIAKILSQGQGLDFLKLKVKSIEFIGQKETQCIALNNSENLYITDDYIVTHNTMVALATTAKIQTRTAIVLLPGYIDQWAQEIHLKLDVGVDEIVTVKGSSQLKSILSLAANGQLDSKFIVISLRTIQNLFKMYEETNGEAMEENGYDCSPEDLFKILGVGTVIIDEVHMHLHSVFKTLLYTHVPKLIALSATLLSDDPFINKMQYLMFPSHVRYDKVAVNKYIKCYSMSYEFRGYEDLDIKTSEFNSTSYSHNVFERSILKRRILSQRYGEFIYGLVELIYMKDYVPGDKCAVYVSSVAMATFITLCLKEYYPELDVKRYCEQDPYTNVMDSDIRVTTLLSAGTALDIKGLTSVIMTTSVLSPVSNLQVLGRLREIPERDVRFLYVYCSQIPKQVMYHRRKKELFSTKVISHKEWKCRNQV
jgi:hypothetical protein